MKTVATAIVLTLLAAVVCSAHATLVLPDPCCGSCDAPEASDHSDTCCRVGAMEISAVVAAQITQVAAPAATPGFSALVPPPADQPASSFAFESADAVRVHSPPRLYLRNTSFLL